MNNHPHEDDVARGLSQFPDYATALGHLAVEWADLEMDLFEAFHKISGFAVPVARVVFFSAQNNRQRITFVSAVAATVLGEDSSDFARVNNILKKIKRTAQKRNSYTHNNWVIVEDARSGQLSPAQMKLTTQSEVSTLQKINLRDISQLKDSIYKQRCSLHNLCVEIAPRLVKRHKELQSQQDIALVYRTRDPKGPKKPKR